MMCSFFVPLSPACFCERKPEDSCARVGMAVYITLRSVWQMNPIHRHTCHTEALCHAPLVYTPEAACYTSDVLQSMLRNSVHSAQKTFRKMGGVFGFCFTNPIAFLENVNFAPT